MIPGSLYEPGKVCSKCQRVMGERLSELDIAAPSDPTCRRAMISMCENPAPWVKDYLTISGGLAHASALKQIEALYQYRADAGGELLAQEIGERYRRAYDNALSVVDRKAGFTR